MFIFKGKSALQRNIYTTLTFGVALFVFSIIGIFSAPSASAKITLDTSPSERAKAYSYWRGAAKCVESHMRGKIFTKVGDNGATSPKIGGGGGSDGTKDGEWFDDLDAWVAVYPDGKLDCAQVMKKGMAVWGFESGKELLTAMGYKFNSDNPPNYTSPAGGDGSARKSAFNSALVTKGGGNFNDFFNGEAKYIAYLGLLQSNKASLSECDGKKVGKYSDIKDATQKSAADNGSVIDGRKYAKITFVDGETSYSVVFTYVGSTTVSGGGYSSEMTKHASVWNYRGSNYAGGTGEVHTCDDLVAKINSNAGSLRLWNKNHPDSQEVDGGNTSTSGGACEDADDPDCEAKTTCAIEGVGWLVCPVTRFLGDLADNAFTFLSDEFLQVKPEAMASTDSNPTYKVWSTMRTIANVAFVIAFLIIIFSQLTGQGIANYGIKKMLPRLIIAAILVNLSFFICQIAVDLSNILGVSLKQAFEAVAQPVSPPGVIGEIVDESGNWAGIITAVLAGVAISWALGLSILLPFLLAAVIAFIMVFLILVVRQVLIVLLVVLSPIAFVAFLLPNTEQWFTKWRKMFVGLLLVFPLIGLLFGAASLGSAIVTASSQTIGATGGDDPSTWISKIIAAGIVALPLFLLPSLLKKSLDAAGNIGETMNRLGSKFGKGAQSKAANSGVMKSLASQKARTRAQIGAGIYSGRNPINKVRSGINSRLNRSGAYNAVTGNYGTIRGANIGKLEGEESKLAESAIQLRARSGKAEDSIESQFTSALARGDVGTATAAQSILMRSGGSGVKAVRNGIAANEQGMSQNMKHALASNVTENHAQAAKAKSADLLNWSGGSGSRSMNEVTADAKTWSGLSARDLADQTDDAFKNALASGGVGADTKAALTSDRMSEALTDAKRAALGSASSSSAPKQSGGVVVNGNWQQQDNGLIVPRDRK